MWVGRFFPCGGKNKTNAHVLKDVLSFLSNSTGPSKSTQQWGLKEEPVNDEIISYNEGYRVHILKYMAIFTNIHTKSDQGEITAHNFHLGRCPKFGHWVPRAQCDI
jgi:hypothetical protein